MVYRVVADKIQYMCERGLTGDLSSGADRIQYMCERSLTGSLLSSGR